jgi:hypothetical protein
MSEIGNAYGTMFCRHCIRFETEVVRTPFPRAFPCIGTPVNPYTTSLMQSLPAEALKVALNEVFSRTGSKV